MDQEILDAVEELRKAGKRIENFGDVLIIVHQALTGIAMKMNEDGIDDDELDQFEDFVDVTKAAIKYEKECREVAYSTHRDSASSTNNARRIATPQSAEEYLQNLLVRLIGVKDDKMGEIA